MRAARLDLYAPIHKALRALMADMVTSVGHMDPADDADVRATFARLEKGLIAARDGSPSLKQVPDHHPLRESRRPLEQLEVIERWLDHDRDTIVEVIGQGVGRVVDANLEKGISPIASCSRSKTRCRGRTCRPHAPALRTSDMRWEDTIAYHFSGYPFLRRPCEKGAGGMGGTSATTHPAPGG